MNILIITKNYYPSTIPDAKRFKGISESFSKMGHNVYIITETNNAVAKSKNIQIMKTKKRGKDSHGMFARLINHATFMFQTIRIGKKLTNIDIVIATSPPLFNLISGTVLKNKLNSKYVLDLRDIWPDVFEQTDIMSNKNIVYKVFDYIARKCYKNSDAIAVVTKGKKELLVNRYPEYAKKIFYLTNGYNSSILNYEEDIKIAKEFEGYFNIIYTGKVGLAQNIEKFIDLANLYKNNDLIRFHIMGSGNGTEKILEYAKELNLDNVLFYGYRSEKEVLTALRHSQIAYVSLVNKKLIDSVPTKIYEAMVCGCPILLSAVGESAELVKDLKFGLSSDPDDFEQLRKNLEFMIVNHESFLKNKDSVLTTMEHTYARNVVAQDYERLLLNLLKGD